MKNILVSALVALTLAGCTPAEPVAVPTSSASAYVEPVVTADSKAPVGFPREAVAVVSAPVAPVAPVVTAEPVELPSEPVAPIAEPVEVPSVPVVTAEPVEAPVSVPEPVEVSEPKEVPAEPVEAHWGHSALAEYGLSAQIQVVDAVAFCRIPSGSGGCAYVGTGLIMLSADMANDWRGRHVLFHEYAHAVLGIVDECEAEAYAHSITGNIVWSYPDCA